VNTRFPPRLELEPVGAVAVSAAVSGASLSVGALSVDPLSVDALSVGALSAAGAWVVTGRSAAAASSAALRFSD